MHRTTLLTVTFAGLLTLMVLPNQDAWAASPSTHRGVAPLPMDAGAIKGLQARLSEKGFSPGQVDGLWGPDTAGALSRFQAANGLQASGRFDGATLAALGPSGAGPVPTKASPLDASAASGVPAVTAPAADPAPGADAATAANPASGVSAAGKPGLVIGGAAEGTGNPAIASAATAPLRPEHGANSFNEAETRRRMAAHGFQHVSDLRKDDMGVWRGAAIHYGQRVQVWLDYKGNVGQQ